MHVICSGISLQQDNDNTALIQSGLLVNKVQVSTFPQVSSLFLIKYTLCVTNLLFEKSPTCMLHYLQHDCWLLCYFCLFLVTMPYPWCFFSLWYSINTVLFWSVSCQQCLDQGRHMRGLNLETSSYNSISQTISLCWQIKCITLMPLQRRQGSLLSSVLESLSKVHLIQ